MNWCVPEDSAFEWGQALNVKGEMSQDGGACHKSSSMHNGAMAFLTSCGLVGKPKFQCDFTIILETRCEHHPLHPAAAGLTRYVFEKVFASPQLG